MPTIRKTTHVEYDLEGLKHLVMTNALERVDQIFDADKDASHVLIRIEEDCRHDPIISGATAVIVETTT